MNASSTLAQEFEQAGFRLVRSNRHHLWACPCGHRHIISSKTPGKGRALKNAQAEIARTLRACGPLRETA